MKLQYKKKVWPILEQTNNEATLVLIMTLVNTAAPLQF